jgi:hypothetical protein
MQKITLGRILAAPVVTVHLAAEAVTVDLGGEDSLTRGRPPGQSAASRPTARTSAAQERLRPAMRS